MPTKTRKRILFIGLVVLTAILGTSLAGAQSGGAFDLTWFTIDGGGSASSGGSYALDGTIGQPDAGAMSGGAYTLASGFWKDAQAILAQWKVYLPLVRKP